MKIPELKRRKGQGAFEYILLVAGILLIVVLVIILLKGGLISQSGANVAESGSKANVNAQTDCLSFCGQGAWSTYGVQSTDFDTNVACNLTDGINNNGSCFYSSTTQGSNANLTVLCNANYVLKSGKAVQYGLQNSSAINQTIMRPQNTLFCGQVRNTAKESS